MRRFRQGATKGPSLLRPGAGYGRVCYGPPGPTQEVQPREPILPELITGEAFDASLLHGGDYSETNSEGDTIIDLTNE